MFSGRPEQAAPLAGRPRPWPFRCFRNRCSEATCSLVCIVLLAAEKLSLHLSLRKVCPCPTVVTARAARGGFTCVCLFNDSFTETELTYTKNPAFKVHISVLLSRCTKLCKCLHRKQPLPTPGSRCRTFCVCDRPFLDALQKWHHAACASVPPRGSVCSGWSLPGVSLPQQCRSLVCVSSCLSSLQPSVAAAFSLSFPWWWFSRLLRAHPLGIAGEHLV